MVLYSAIHSNLTDRIDELENEILRREDKMCEIEAKVFLDHLLALHERLIAYEIQFETNVTDYTYLTTHLRRLRPYHLKILDLQIKLTRIFSPTSSKYASTSKTKVNNPYRNQNENLESVEKLHTRIQKQKFIINQIESVETSENICPAKAEVLYNHIGQLFNTFISNQVQIDTLVDDGSTLVTQQKIASEVQRKVIHFQTNMNKIITPAPKSSTKFNSQEDDGETTHTDTSADLDLLFKKRESTINRIASLEQKNNLSPEKAEILYQHLTPLYQSFISDQNEIETLVSGTLLESQQEISRQIQNKVIELQTMFKKIFAPITPSSVTELKTCSDLIVLFNELFISDQNGNGNKRATHHSQLEISRDIHRKLNCLQSTLNRILSSPAVSTYLTELNVNEQSSQAQTSSQMSVAVDNNDKLNLAFKRPRMSILDESFSRQQ